MSSSINAINQDHEPMFPSALLVSESQESLLSSQSSSINASASEAFTNVSLDSESIRSRASSSESSKIEAVPLSDAEKHKIKVGSRILDILGIAVLVAGIALLCFGIIGLSFIPALGGLMIGVGFMATAGGIVLMAIAGGDSEPVENPPN